MGYFIAVVGILLWVLVFLGGVVCVADEIKNGWIRFWVSRNRCPKCFRKMYHFNDRQEYDYCSVCMDIAYYEDFVRVAFRDE